MEDRITLELDKHDLKMVERLVKSDDFARFLLANTTQLCQAGLIMQTLLDKIEECKKALKEQK